MAAALVSVRFLQSMAHVDNDRDAGAVKDLPAEKAQRLVDAGICEFVDAPASARKPARGRPPKSEE